MEVTTADVRPWLALSGIFGIVAGFGLVLVLLLADRLCNPPTGATRNDQD
jgi:hypothetical protein